MYALNGKMHMIYVLILDVVTLPTFWLKISKSMPHTHKESSISVT